MFARTRLPRLPLIALATSLLLAISCGSASASFSYLSKFGSFGSGDGQLVMPWGIGIDPAHGVHLTDASDRVQRFAPDGSYLSTVGSPGTASGQLKGPFGVAFDPAGNQFVVEGTNARLDRFTPSGSFSLMSGYGVQNGANAFQTCSAGCQAGIDGPGPGQFEEALAVATTPSGDVLVVNKEGPRVDLYSGSSLAHDSLFAGGVNGTAEDEFKDPQGIAVDAAGNVYVTDFNNFRVSKFDSDGNVVMVWGYGVQNGAASFQTCSSGCQAGLTGSGAGQLAQPTGIAVDDATGRVYVSDSGNNRVNIYSTSGAYIDAFGSAGTGDGAFNAPLGIALDCKGAVYVVDFGNARVQRFGEPDTPLCSFGGSGPDPTPAPGPATPAGAAPKLFDLTISPKRFRVGGKTKRGNRLNCKTKKAKKRKRCAIKSTQLIYRSSEAATVKFTIDGILKGHKVGKKCKRTTAKNKRKQRCTAYRKATTFTSQAKPGENRTKFTGKFGKKKLRPGNYRITAVATNAAGSVSQPVIGKFTILRR